MRTSDRGIDLIKRFEGFSSKAYRCPGGVLTCGFGHTKGIHEGQTCTEEQAEMWLRADVHEAEDAVNLLAQEVRLNQDQFDALVSFVFNVGSGAFNKSTLRKKVQAFPDNPSIRDEFERWVYSGGKVLAGLVARRNAEADLYFGEV